MSKQSINLGTIPTGAGGDSPRSAFTKTEANITELYGALGATGNPLTIPAALPITKGGTGSSSQAGARTALGLKSAATADIVGTVATGAIMEQGNTGEHYYVRFACGAQQCWGPVADFYAVAGGVTTGPVTNYAAAFAGALQSVYSFGTPNISGDVYGYTYNSVNGLTQFAHVYRNGTAAAQTITNGRYFAIGRWK